MRFKATGMYIGECKKKDGNWIRQGRGIHMVSENRRIDGFWNEDQLNGFGRIIESNYMCKGK